MNAVDAFLAELEHPKKAEIQALRSLLLGVSPEISEGIKWKAPSFRTRDDFATMHLKAKDGVGLILHLGAKVKALPPGGLVITDSEGLLKWLAKDRAIVVFTDLKEIESRRPALEAIVRQWIRYVE